MGNGFGRRGRTTFRLETPVQYATWEVAAQGSARWLSFWFVVLFALTGTTSRLEYRLIDSRGVVKASGSFAGKTFFPGAQPILIGTQIVWVDVDQKSRSAAAISKAPTRGR